MKLHGIILITLGLLVARIKGLDVVFQSGVSVKLRDGLTYVGGCKYIYNKDISASSYLLVNGTTKVKLYGISLKLRNVTETPVTSAQSLSKSSTTQSPFKIVAPQLPISIPKTIPKFPIGKIGFPKIPKLPDIPKEVTSIGKEIINKKLEELLKNKYLFELPDILLQLPGVYQCAVQLDGTNKTILSEASSFMNLPAPTIYTHPVIGKETSTVGRYFTIKGCVIKSNVELLEGDIYWMVDGHRKIDARFKKQDNTYTVQDLIYEVSSLEDQGYYQCVASSSADVNKPLMSKKVHVQFKDTSTTKISMKLNKTWSDAYLSKSSEEYIIFLKMFDKSMRKAIQSSKTYLISVLSMSAGSINVEAKVMFAKVQDKEKVALCKSPSSFLNRLVINEDLNAVDIKVQSLDCCNAKTLGEDDFKGVYTLPQAIASTNTQQSCRYNSNEKMSVECTPNQNTGAIWSKINLSKCLPKFNSTRRLLTLDKIAICNSNRRTNCSSLVDVAKQLKDIVKENGINTKKDFKLTIDIISKSANDIDHTNVKDVPKSAQLLLNVLDIVLLLPVTLFGSSQVESLTSSILTHALDDFAQKYIKYLKIFQLLPLPSNQLPLNLNLEGESIAFRIDQNKKRKDLLIIAKQVNNEVRIDMTTDLNTNLTLDIISMIKLPAEAFNLGEDLVYSYFYRTPKLFLAENMLLKALGKMIKLETAVQSNVLSASIGKKEIKNLTHPIVLTFKRSLAKNLTGVNDCHFWDMNIKTSFANVKGGWSDRGCQPTVTEHTSEDYFSCECNHLTNFALLLDISQTGENPLEMSIVTWTGCALSLVGLFLTIVSYVAFKNIRRKLPPKLLLCLSISLFVLLVVFLAGIQAASHRLLCQAIAAVLHYFILTTFFWMAVESISLYRMFVRVFKHGSDTKFLRRALMVAWGTPAIIVAFTVGFAHQDYGTDRICMVTGLPFFISVVAPVAMIILFNSVVLIMVMRGLSKLQKRQHQENKNSQMTQARIAFSCNVLLGITWVFALFAVAEATRVFQWLFCISNSLQGFFIFIFYTIRNKDVMTEWKMLFGMNEDQAGSKSTKSFEVNMKEEHSTSKA